MMIHRQGGDVTVSTAQPPANLPAFAPIFAGAKMSSSITNGTGGIGGIVTFDTAERRDGHGPIRKARRREQAHLAGRRPGDADGSHLEVFGQPGTQRGLNLAVRPADSGTGTTVGLTYGAR